MEKFRITMCILTLSVITANVYCLVLNFFLQNGAKMAIYLSLVALNVFTLRIGYLQETKDLWNNIKDNWKQR
ncbi:hypothetical protein [Paenibacillus sp. Pae108]|uniref:hypothetical protein n=1 Tax=Paenibacillus sp. Pae108 TaxID=2926019 RepID=UPI002119717C|nr:hypothetical protein [Paenibacillus sp. Pae108]